LEIRPEGIGLFFPLARSRSASTRSFKIYVPAVTSREARGRGMVCHIMVKGPDPADIAFMTPGRQKSPVIVARQYKSANFLRDWKRTSWDLAKEICILLRIFCFRFCMTDAIYSGSIGCPLFWLEYRFGVTITGNS
jgi:hypothetical protein